VEFLVKLTPHLPDTLTEDELADLFKRERARGSGFLKAGKMRRMWRLPGTKSALLLWDVESPDELHEHLTSLPVSRYCDVEVTTLIQHPLEAAHEASDG
jgi:muconolactone D-isomerase